jgi:hypothetical protein
MTILLHGLSVIIQIESSIILSYIFSCFYSLSSLWLRISLIPWSDTSHILHSKETWIKKSHEKRDEKEMILTVSCTSPLQSRFISPPPDIIVFRWPVEGCRQQKQVPHWWGGKTQRSRRNSPCNPWRRLVDTRQVNGWTRAGLQPPGLPVYLHLGERSE